MSPSIKPETTALCRLATLAVNVYNQANFIRSDLPLIGASTDHLDGADQLVFGYMEEISLTDPDTSVQMMYPSVIRKPDDPRWVPTQEAIETYLLRVCTMIIHAPTEHAHALAMELYARSISAFRNNRESISTWQQAQAQG